MAESDHESLDAYLDYYGELVTTLSNSDSLFPRFVSKRIITLAQFDGLASKMDKFEKVQCLLNPIGTSLESGNVQPFYNLLEIMNAHGNEDVKSLADEVRSAVHAKKCFAEPVEAANQFDIVVLRIAEQLDKCISQNDRGFKPVYHYLTQTIPLLSPSDKSKIKGSKSFSDIFEIMCLFWNWTSHCLLKCIIEKVKSPKSLEMLEQFDERINKQLPLEIIHNHLLPSRIGYCEMVAIFQLEYSKITLEKGLDIEEFVSDYVGQLGAQSSRPNKSSSEYTEMIWHVPTTIIETLCSKVFLVKEDFLHESFLFLRIGNCTIIDLLPDEITKPPSCPISSVTVLHDPIHGHFEMDPLLVKIIDTPQFQRLRYIKQLGGAYYVFSGASHNRFEHSIGVCYLAGELVNTLKTKQPELCITENDVLCVKVAGLCHNLGCAPFSFMFERKFIPLVRVRVKQSATAVKMFDHLIKENDLGNLFEASDLEFIKELITNPKKKDWHAVKDRTGRGKEKEFLYQVVINKLNGVDVNKWDYFARDCYHLGIPNAFDFNRYMAFARVIKYGGEYQICTRDKEAHNLYSMFYMLYLLHVRAYQHKTVNAVELMICDAFIKADGHLILRECNGEQVSLSQSIDDMYAFSDLTDYVFQQILASRDPKLKESQELLNRIVRRKLYKYIGRVQPSNPIELAAKDIADQIINCAGNETPALSSSDLSVDIVIFDYGMNLKNPIEHVWFYTKDQPNKAVLVKGEKISKKMHLREFEEQEIRLYCKKSEECYLKAAEGYFTEWCSKHGHAIILKGHDLEFDSHFSPYFTHSKSLQTDQDSAEGRDNVKKNLFDK